MAKTGTGFFRKSPANAILISGLVAGTLDMLTALVVYSVVLHKTTAIRILHSIASGVFGKGAYDGGTAMAVAGIAFHYLIAFTWAILYFFAFPKIPVLKKNWILSGLFYGLFVWGVMNLGVLPLVFAHRSPLTWSSFLIGAFILMVMIGLPVSFITRKYYESGNR